ncbi:MAG: 5-methyltetrahydropteroyltriglutamate--homocysteine methyltransferase [Gammaproteobacteria bacterium]|nr:5-methyltetrahydropteroyltriglutamate--homocysteine methyltransferase [Gammaproteobacteria bacterium]
MPLLTTCIGAYPKPDYVELPDWFNVPAGPDTADPTRLWLDAIEAMGSEAEQIIARGINEAVQDQVSSGIDIPTDGEISRENYIHYHCRHLKGFDFVNLTAKEVRGGTYSASLPSIVGPVSVMDEFLTMDWKRAQAFTDKPLKITMPGPMTISDTNSDLFYNDPKKLGADVADALNVEVRALANAGCKYIQIDEPLFARKPEEALDYGFENLERAFHGCPDSVVRTVHMCCGYPDRLDHPNYPKADPDSYFRVADAVESSSINAVSFEDAHRHNDLSLLEHFKTTSVIFGVVAIAKSHVESVEEIQDRLLVALNHIDADRLIAAPDCGLGLLGRDLALAKMRNLSLAAKSV